VNRPMFVFVDVSSGWRTPSGRAGVRAAHHQLRCAYAIAALRANGYDARQIVQRRLGPLRELVADIVRAAPDHAILWAPEPATPAVDGLGVLLAQRLPDVRVLRAGTGTDLGDELETPLLALAAGHEPGAGPFEGELAALASPWLTGTLPASAAEVVGVELDRPGSPLRCHAAQRVLDEIAWIDAAAIEPCEVELHGAGPARDPAGVIELLTRLALVRRRHVRPTVRGGAAPDADLLAALAAAGGERISVVLTADEAPAAAATRIRAWQDAGAAAGVAIDVVADLPSDAAPAQLDALLAQVAPQAPGLRYCWRPAAPARPPRRPSGLACPELAGTHGYREESGLERAVLARLLRAHEGLYPPAAGYADAPAEVIWGAADPPAGHAAWLADLLSPTSLLFVDGAAGSLVAPGPLAELWGLTPEHDGRLRLDAGDAIDVVPYADAASRHPDVPSVLTWADRADADALLADADEAHATGFVPAGLRSGLTRLQDAVVWLAADDDPAPRLARLWIDGDGAVRPGPAAGSIGTLGDAASQLLANASALPAPASLPGWLEPDELMRWQSDRPWLVAYAAAPQARRRVAEVLGPAAASDLRLSGLGGRLHYDGDGAAAPVARHVLLRAGAADLLLDPVSGRLARLNAEVAAAWEALACTHDAAAAAAWLAARPGADAARARAVVANVAVRLATSLQAPRVHAQRAESSLA
jgi:hypothetical protein